MNEEFWYLKDANCRISAHLCGTASQKTIIINCNCEMTRESALKICTNLRKAVKHLDTHEKNCQSCSDRSICPDRGE